MSKRDDFQKSMEENLALWGARLTTMAAKLKTDTPPEGRAAEGQRLEEFQARSKAVARKLEALKGADSNQWDVLKLEMASAWHDLDGVMAVAEAAMRARDDAARTPPAA